MQQGAARAVRGAPEPGRAVLAARQQALSVGAKAEPVDAPAVVGADPQGRTSTPHSAGGGGPRRRPRAAREGPLGVFAAVPGGCVPRPSRGHRLRAPAEAPVAVEAGDPRYRAPTRSPSPLTLRGLRPRGRAPLGVSVTAKQPQPHRRGNSRPETAPTCARMSQGALESAGRRGPMNPGSEAPRAPSAASAARCGRQSSEQYSPARLLLRDHPSTCPLPLLGPALPEHPPRPPLLISQDRP